jgi:hypothetical protein
MWAVAELGIVDVDIDDEDVVVVVAKVAIEF